MTLHPHIAPTFTWTGFFADPERGAAWLLLCGVGLLIRWGDRYEIGHMARSEMIARRDRLTGQVEVLVGYDWRPSHPVNWPHFRLGSPPLIKTDP